MTTSFPRTKLRATKVALLCAVALPALMALTPAAAKTLVYCSEGSPENFAPSINTTGTSFDATEQIYDNLVKFERGGTQVTPGLAEKWTVSKDGLEYVFNLRKGVKWHSNKNFKPSRDFNADDFLFTMNRQWVFASDGGYALHLSGQGGRYLVLAGFSYLVTAVASAVLPDLLGIHELAAFALSAIAMAGVSFVLLNLWVFRAAPPEPAS